MQGCPAPYLPGGLLPLAPLGNATRPVHRYFAQNSQDRGVTYTPIAVMVPQFHGMGLGFWDLGFSNTSLADFRNPPGDSQAGPWAAGLLPYTEGDREMIYLMMLLFGKS
eukprot:COSAG02_NODE_21682_length_779_cov_0.647059_2_plen_108_part_01